MKIVIVGSIELSDKLIEMSNELEIRGIETFLPHSTEKIKAGELTLDEYRARKAADGGDFVLRQTSNIDFIKDHYNAIKDSDGILVVNFDKKRIKNYIGGNALMELGFAYTMDKPIYLYNDIPEMPYTDEIKAVKPIVINGDLSKIKAR